MNVVGVGTPGCKISINFTPDIPVQSVRHQLDAGCQLWLHEATSFFAGANEPITCSGNPVYYSADTRIVVWNTDNQLQPGQQVNCGIICCNYPDLDQNHSPFDQVAGALSISKHVVLLHAGQSGYKANTAELVNDAETLEELHEGANFPNLEPMIDYDSGFWGMNFKRDGKLMPYDTTPTPSFMTYMYIAACTGGEFGDQCSTSKDCCLDENYHCQLRNSAHFHADNECYAWTSECYPWPSDLVLVFSCLSS